MKWFAGISDRDLVKGMVKIIIENEVSEDYKCIY